MLLEIFFCLSSFYFELWGQYHLPLKSCCQNDRVPFLDFEEENELLFELSGRIASWLTCNAYKLKLA